MLSNNVILITHATHFVGPTAPRVLKAEGAKVICHDTEFANAQVRADFKKMNKGGELVHAANPVDVVTEALGIHGHLDVRKAKC